MPPADPPATAAASTLPVPPTAPPEPLPPAPRNAPRNAPPHNTDARIAAPSADAEPPAGTPALNKTMRLVLQELRMQRGTSGETPQLTVVALAIQAVAFICLLAALWMGAGSGGDGAFFRWIGVALFLQLAVIATLLFARPSA
ncbi:MAG: hypothetical protein AAGG38_13030 [Planctomycetota bacterium]